MLIPGTSKLSRSHAMGYTVLLDLSHLVANTWVPPFIFAGVQNHLSHGLPRVSPEPCNIYVDIFGCHSVQCYLQELPQ